MSVMSHYFERIKNISSQFSFIKCLHSGQFLVQCGTQKASEALCWWDCKQFVDRPIQLTMHRSHNSCKGRSFITLTMPRCQSSTLAELAPSGLQLSKESTSRKMGDLYPQILFSSSYAYRKYLFSFFFCCVASVVSMMATELVSVSPKPAVFSAVGLAMRQGIVPQVPTMPTVNNCLCLYLVFCFTETWYHSDIPDSALQLPGFSIHCADCSPELSGKNVGSGMHFLINNIQVYGL